MPGDRQRVAILVVGVRAAVQRGGQARLDPQPRNHEQRAPGRSSAARSSRGGGAGQSQPHHRDDQRAKE